jgi:hypothetical protein
MINHGEHGDVAATVHAPARWPWRRFAAQPSGAAIIGRYANRPKAIPDSGAGRARAINRSTRRYAQSHRYAGGVAPLCYLLESPQGGTLFTGGGSAGADHLTGIVDGRAEELATPSVPPFFPQKAMLSGNIYTADADTLTTIVDVTGGRIPT